MLMIFLLFAVVAVVAGVIFLQPTPRRKVTPANPDEFRAVSVTFDQAEACPAVRELALRRFLCSEAPMLPLTECTAASCECRFEHHADRRTGPRRADETGVFQPLFEGAEHRTEPRGRRAEDLGDDAPAPEAAPEAESFDPTATYYDFIAQTGIRPETGK